MFKCALFFNIFFIDLYGGLIEELGLPGYFSLLSEISIYLLLLLSLVLRSGKGVSLAEFWYVLVCFLLITPFSALLNDTPLFRSIGSIRLLFRFYLFYLAIIWLDPNDRFIKNVNIFLIVLLVFQFPYILIKFLNHGIAEETMGAWVRSGAVSAMLWASGLFYLAAFYFLHKPNKYLIALACGFIIASIIGAKRVILFIYPVQLLAIYYYIYSKSEGTTFSRKFLGLLVISVIIISVSGSILYFNKSLNPEGEVGGEIKLSYALEYANRYNAGISASGYSYGRVATTTRVVEILFDAGFMHIILGKGPGATTPTHLDNKKSRQAFEERFDDFKIQYGLTPMARILLEYGIVCVMAYCWMLYIFVLRSWKLYMKETDPYWKAFSAGSLGFSCLMAFFFFCYSHSAFWGETMPALFFYAMAVVHLRYQYRYPIHRAAQSMGDPTPTPI